MNIQGFKKFWNKDDEVDIYSKIGVTIFLLSSVATLLLLPIGLFTFEFISWFDPNSDFEFRQRFNDYMPYTGLPAIIMLYAFVCRFFSTYIIFIFLAARSLCRTTQELR